MKKLTERYHKWLRYKQKQKQDSYKKPSKISSKGSGKVDSHVVECWTQTGVVKAIAKGRTIPPANLCYKTNPNDTFEFVGRWCNGNLGADPHSNRKFEWITFPKNPKAIPRLGRYVDFSRIEYISTAVALVMTAEFDRAATRLRQRPPAIDLERWNDGVFKKLFDIGFFENIGLVEELEDKFTTEGDIKTLKITSGKNAAELEMVCGKISQLCEFMDLDDPSELEQTIHLNTALGEAMINVAKHAYPTDHKFERPHVNKWWVTASVDRSENILKVAILDQGATIPITFPRKRTHVRVTDSISQTLSKSDPFAYQSDGTYIHEAMQPGMTQTDEKHRGKGLPEMREIIDALGNASMIIYSRGGVCQYGSNGFVYNSQPTSIGGTLIEWTLSFGGDV